MQKLALSLLEKFLTSLDIGSNGSLKRLLVLLLALFIPILNKKLGLELKTEEIAVSIMAAIAYLWQSGLKAKALAEIEKAKIEADKPAAPQETLK